MIIHRLSIVGFKIIGEPINLEFPESGRIGIFGSNESGKSTLLESIEYALYGLGKGKAAGVQRKDNVTWGKDKAKFEIEFSSGENRYILHREIGAEHGHNARLYLVTGSTRSLLEINITRIQEEIEKITGMDRDTFSKLIYIKQKDLDALKDLQRSQREQLINRVMGMDVFDIAVANVKTDKSSLENKLSEKEQELKLVQKYKEEYEWNISRRDSLKPQLDALQAQEHQISRERDAMKVTVAKYEWLAAKKSKNDLLEEKRRNLEKTNVRRKHLDELRQQYNGLEAKTKVHQVFLDTNAPRYEGYRTTLEKFLFLESDLQNSSDALRETEERRLRELERYNLSDEDLAIVGSKLQKTKSRSLIITILLTVIGTALAFVTFGISLVLLVPAAFSYKQYRQLENLTQRTITVQSIDQDLSRKKSALTELHQRLEALKKDTGFTSSSQVKAQIAELLIQLKQATGQDTFEGLKAILNQAAVQKRQLDTEISTIEKENLDVAIQGSMSEIGSIEAELVELEKSKPASIEGMEYGETEHLKAKSELETLLYSYNVVSRRLSETQATLREVENKILELKPTCDKFPELYAEVQSLREEVKLRERVINEINETSKELRSKVLPQARYIINQILPTITDGRYSDLDITADLKFNVHSMEAGDYKQRDVFSGGTQDQFLIALRLAFTQSILDSRVKADTYSLLMDECTSSSDDVRKQKIFEVLNALSSTFRQIFVISHEEEIENYVDHRLILGRNANNYAQIKGKSW